MLEILRDGAGGAAGMTADAAVDFSAGGSLMAAEALELGNLLGIIVEIAAHLGERVPSKFLQKSIG